MDSEQLSSTFKALQSFAESGSAISTVIQMLVIAARPRSPAARSRALRFLEGVGEAPADFDPLADRDARRAALQADRERRESEATAEVPR